MALGAKKFLSQTKSERAPQLPENPSTSGDPNPFWQGTLFSDVYLRNDVPTKYKDLWELEESGSFYEFCEQFRNLCTELSGENFSSWSERTTINRFIKPILKMLGYFDKCSANQEPWTEDEPFTITEAGEPKIYKPDFVIVNNPKELKYIEQKSGQEKVDEARGSVILSIEAKYWGRIDDSKSSRKEDAKRADKHANIDASRLLDFDEQCLGYMDLLNNDYGILTDGRTWRLYHKDLSSGTFRRFYQFNLGKLLKHVSAGLDSNLADYKTYVDNAKYFYHFFSKPSLFNEGGRRFVDDLIEDSKKYASKLEEDLKIRFVNAMTIACNGFVEGTRRGPSEEQLAAIRSAAESQIFNILFIRFCESCNILPMRQNPEYRKMSLSNTIDKLEFYDPEKEDDDLNLPHLRRMFAQDFKYSHEGNELHDRLLALTDAVQNGTKNVHAKFAIHGFRETVFSSDEQSFLQKHKLNNRMMCRLLFELAYTDSDLPGRKFQQIAYTYFAPRQLGSIYESFLEYRLAQAESDMVLHKGQWVAANLRHDNLKDQNAPRVTNGALYFFPDNKKRKATGSYYTPDYVVQKLVSESIRSALNEKSSADILKFKVCDPAMGSGHFLSAALHVLATSYIRALDRETPNEVSLSPRDVKGTILGSCIYGVDINPRAVKLAKMSLWLESASSNNELEHLDDQLICRDSLQGKVSDGIQASSFQGFDAFLGNPPWGGELTANQIASLNSKYPEASYKLNDTFKYFIAMCIEQVKKNGVVALIVPRSLLTHIGCRDIREQMLGYRVVQLFDLGDSVFKGVTCPSCMFVLSRTTAPTNSDYEFTFVDASKEQGADRLLKAPSHQVRRSVCLSNANKEFSLAANKTREFSQQGCLSLKDLAEVFDSGLDYSRKALGDAVFYSASKPESRNDHKVLRGRNVQRFTLAFGDLWLRGAWRDIEQRQKKSDSKTRLKVNTKAYDASPKILLRQTADEVIATIDFDGYYNQKSLLSVHPKDNAHAFFLLGMLNSTAITEQYRDLVQEEDQVFSQVKKNKLEQLMIPFRQDAKLEKEIASISEQLVKLNSTDDPRYSQLMSKLNKSVDLLFEKVGCSSRKRDAVA